MPQLDGLRALAAIAVIFSHAFEQQTELSKAFGQNAVRLFFVLSGFLITSILLGARGQAEATGGSRFRVIKAFYARRSLRIFPVYYFVLGIAWLVGLEGLRENLFWQLTYTTNIHFALDRQWHGAAQHLWTLAIEEQFYLIWPVLILFLPRRMLPVLGVAAVIGGPLCRLALLLQTHSSMRATLLLPSFVDALGIGGLLAWLRVYRPGLFQWARWSFLGCGLVLGAVAGLTTHKLRVVFEISSAALISAWLVGAVANGLPGVIGRVLESRVFVYLGTISYGLYLYHPFFGELFGPLWGLWSRFGVNFVVTLGVASISWFLLEKPLNELKRYFPYSGRQRRAAKPEAAGEHRTLEPTAVLQLR